jgi:hypothetical protein
MIFRLEAMLGAYLPTGLWAQVATIKFMSIWNPFFDDFI